MCRDWVGYKKRTADGECLLPWARSVALTQKSLCAALCPPGAVTGSCDAKKVGHGFVGKAAAHGRPPLVEPKLFLAPGRQRPGFGPYGARLGRRNRKRRIPVARVCMPRFDKDPSAGDSECRTRAADRRTIAGDLQKTAPTHGPHGTRPKRAGKTRGHRRARFSHSANEFSRGSPSSDRLAHIMQIFGEDPNAFLGQWEK